jgi:LysM repeat protein
MTERGLPLVDGAPACPFVAFEDDRDERAPSPDHRHRCYAEIRPAPRALAHQAAYCLSSAFPVCPTFQDWARREAAKARNGEAAVDEPPRRNPPREWSDPPPWTGDTDEEANDERRYRDEERPYRDDGGLGLAAAAGGGAAGAAAGAGAGGAAAGAAAAGVPTAGAASDAPDFLAGRSREAAGLAGSPADRLAAGEPVSDAWRADADEAAGRPAEGASSGARLEETPDRVEAFEEFEPDEGRPRSPRAASRPPERGLIDRRPRVGETRRTRPPVDMTGPSWEQPRRYEAYPTLRTRMGLPSIPRVALMAVALGIAAIALFSLPTILGLGQSNDGGGVVSSPSNRPATSAESAGPTTKPASTAQVYVVKPGDNLGKIAKRFKTTIDAILRANPQIKDANKIKVGDAITIPTKGASGTEPSSSAAP